MGKELECLEKLKHNVQDEIAVHYIGYAYRLKEEVHKYDEDFNTIKQALQRLAAIDNSSPSEALECLGVLYSNAIIESGWVKERVITYAEEIEHNEAIKPYYDTIKQALIKAQEQEKVLEIVFEKLVDMELLSKCETLEEYNYHTGTKYLTQEEFDLLKRWVG